MPAPLGSWKRIFSLTVLLVIGVFSLNGCGGCGSSMTTAVGGGGTGELIIPGGAALTLKSSDGTPASGAVPPQRALTISGTDLPANAQVEVVVRGAGATLTAPNGEKVHSFAVFSIDDRGNLPSHLAIPPLPAGSYELTLSYLKGSQRAGTVTRTLEVSGVGAGPVIDVGTISGGVLSSTRAIPVGTDIGVRATGLPASKEVDIYVARFSSDYGSGLLSDVSGYLDNGGVPDTRIMRGTFETSMTDSTGSLPLTKVWSAVKQEAAGKGFEVILDLNKNGVFDQGTDIRQDSLTGGFAVISPGRADPGGTEHQLATDQAGNAKEMFDFTDDAFVSLPSTWLLSQTAPTICKVYVVQHSTELAGQLLNDVSGPAGARSQVEVQVIYPGMSQIRLQAYPSNLMAGRYSVVVDVNLNDRFDPGVDLVDGTDSDGFEVRENKKQADWHFIFFINGDNNLEDSYRGVISLMEHTAFATVNGKQNVVATVLFDTASSGMALYQLQQGSDSNIERIETLPYYTETDFDSGDPVNFRNAILDAKRLVQADKTCVAVVNHGGGFIDGRGISYDDGSGNNLSVRDVSTAIRAAGRVDLVILDGCLMSSVETLAEMQGSCDYLVMSRRISYTTNMEHHKSLDLAAATPSTSAREMARKYIQNGRDFAKVHPDFKIGMGAFDMGFAASHLNHWKELASYLKDNQGLPYDITSKGIYIGANWRDWTFAAQAAQSALSPGDTAQNTINSVLRQFKDVKQFLAHLETNSRNGTLQAKVDLVKQSLDVLLEDSFVSALVADEGVISVWLPEEGQHMAHQEEYRDGAFARHTKWSDFLAIYHNIRSVTVIEAQGGDFSWTSEFESDTIGSGENQFFGGHWTDYFGVYQRSYFAFDNTPSGLYTMKLTGMAGPSAEGMGDIVSGEVKATCFNADELGVIASISRTGMEARYGQNWQVWTSLGYDNDLNECAIIDELISTGV